MTRLRRIRFCLIVLASGLIPAAGLRAQDPVLPPTLPGPVDSTVIDLPSELPPDSLGLRSGADIDTLANAPGQDQEGRDPAGDLTQPRPPGSGAQRVVQFTARDSLVLDLSAGEEVVRLVGEASLTFESVAVKAYAVDFLLDRSEMQARGLPADTGTVGLPEFTQGEETFIGKELAYNLESGKGRVVQGRSSISDGFLFAEVTKATPDSVIYAYKALYTTCIEDTSYSIRASKVKVVKGKQTYTGPLHVRIFNIPLPFWLPFGVLPPDTEGRKSGPLAPTWGDDRERGFYLRDFGWYFAMNDYMDFQTQFGLWSLGSWQVRPQFRYSKRYAYSGGVTLDWVSNKRGERGDPEPFRASRTTRSLRWNHNQTVDPSTSFTADVNLSSSSYLQTVSRRYNDQVRQTIESNVNFTRRWTGSGRTLTAYVGHRQLLSSGEVTSSLPRLKFSQRTTNPFKRGRSSGGKEKWFERIALSYNGQVDNLYTFKPDTSRPGARDISWFDALVSQQKYEQATGLAEPFDFKATHSIPVNASFSIERLPILNKTFRLNLTPNFNYDESWYIQTERRAIDDSTGRMVTSREPGFEAIRTFNSGVSANTEFYGLFPFRMGRFQGLRHVVRPSMSFSFQPNFSSDRWKYTRTYTDTTGTEIRYPIVRSLPFGEQRRLSLSIGNEFQTRAVTVDSTGEVKRRTVQLLTVNVGSSVNFAADSLRIAPLVLSARTRVLDRFDFNFSSTHTLYDSDERGREINRLLISQGFPFLRLRNMNFTARTTLKSAQRTGASRPVEGGGALFGNNDARFGDPRSPFYDPTAAPGYDPGIGYADFAIPWSIDLDLTYSNSRFGLQSNRRVILNAGFDFNLTPNWKVRGRSGFDFIEREIVTTSLNIFRDLRCWEMSLAWSPFGTYQSYQFSLNVKSGKLREYLKLRHPKRDMQNRFDILERGI